MNKPELFEGGYERYLQNRLHEELPFSEVPIKLLFSERRRMDLGALKGGAHRAGKEEDGDLDADQGVGLDPDLIDASDDGDDVLD